MKFKRLLSFILAAVMIAATFGVIVIPATAATVPEAPVLSNASKWDGSTVDTSWYTSNTSASTFTIADAADLAGFAKLVNDGTTTFEGKTVKLSKDIISCE